MRLEITTAIAMLGAGSSAYLWDADRREDSYLQAHEVITADAGRKNAEAELQRTELEIKMLVEWSTRRQLTEAESDRLEYLRAVRVLLKEQLAG
jgi:hypothetical protein